MKNMKIRLSNKFLPAEHHIQEELMMRILQELAEGQFVCNLRRYNTRMLWLLVLLVNLVRTATPLEVFLEQTNFTDFGEELVILRDDSGNVDIIDTILSINIVDFIPERHLIYFLYTRTSAAVPQIIKIGDFVVVNGSGFSPERPTRFLIHGWLGHVTTGFNEHVRSAYLSSGDYNVIVVDWSVGATARYVFARHYVSRVGKAIARFVDQLHDEYGLSLDSVYLVGFSLGAHIAGVVGRSVKTGRINTIFALDPALPGFYNSVLQDDVLRSDDAGYVESIHTNAGIFGFGRPVGQASFYPNFGVFQPGCERNQRIQCSHERAFMYFAETIKGEKGFYGVQCFNHEQVILLRTCSLRGKHARMGGDPSSSNTSGVYYVPTRSKSPFALYV